MLSIHHHIYVCCLKLIFYGSQHDLYIKAYLNAVSNVIITNMIIIIMVIPKCYFCREHIALSL